MRQKASEYLQIKLRIAREYLGVSQGNIQRTIGVPQSRTSQYENKIMDAIPTILWEYYATNGINMTALLHPAVIPDQFNDILKKHDPGIVVTTTVGDCASCKQKDEENRLLRMLIQAKDDLIASFKK